MKLYFAHSVSDYSTAYEGQCYNVMRLLGYVVENPNQSHHQEGYRIKGMSYFLDDVLPHCDGVAFAPLPSGWVGAGVAMEVDWFINRGRPIYMVDDRALYTFATHEFLNMRRLTRDETRGATRVLSGLQNGGRP